MMTSATRLPGQRSPSPRTLSQARAVWSLPTAPLRTARVPTPIRPLASPITCYMPAAPATLSVTDNGTGDANSASGVIEVDRVCLGSYTVTETAAPTGFALASPASQGPTSLTASTPNATITFTFQDLLGKI